MVGEIVKPSSTLINWRLEIRAEDGELVKIIVADKASNTVTVEYPDGRKEIIGAFD